MEKLTREEALAKHREMWTAMQSELGDNPGKMARDTFKYDWCSRHDGTFKIRHSCYLCEYAEDDCKKCPIKWPGGNCGTGKVDYVSSPISEILALPEKNVRRRKTEKGGVTC